MTKRIKCRLVISLGLIALVATLTQACAGPAAVSRWKRLGPEGGRVDSLIYSPAFARDKKVFAHTEAGFFRSDNAAQTWTKMTVSSGGQSVLSIALSPNFGADKTIFATTLGGHFRSTDDGQTWRLIKKYVDPGPDSPPARFFVSPDYAKDHTIFLSQIGLYKSTDKGRTWKETQSSIADMVFSPNYAEDKNILAIYEEGEGPDVRLYLSTDRGQAWAQVDQSALGGSWGSSAAFSPGYAKNATVFFWQRNSSAGHVFMSTDGARNWSGAGLGKVGHVAFSPRYRSDKTIFAGGEAGLYKSTDGGRSWEQSEHGRTLTKIVSISVPPGHKQKTVVYLVRESQGLYRSADGGKTWSRVSKSLKKAGVTGVYPSPSYSTDKTLLAATLEGVYRSTDGGRRWTINNSGLKAVIISSVAPSPNIGFDNTIFAGSRNSLYKSADRGLTWRRIRKFAEVESGYGPQIAVSPDFAADRTMFFGAADGVHKTTNAGLTWTNLTRTSNQYYVSRIAVSPNYAADRTLFTSSGNSGSDPTSRFLQSSDGGARWRQIKLIFHGINFSPTVIRFSPAFATDKTVIASDSFSIYKSTDGGKTFRRLKSDFHNDVSNIVLSPDYANDEAVVAVIGGFGDGITYRSTAGGKNWRRVKGVGLFLAFSPDYAFDKTLFTESLTSPGKIFRSTDNAKTLTPLPRRPEPWLETIVPSPDYAHDKTIFAVPGTGLSSFTFAN